MNRFLIQQLQCDCLTYMSVPNNLKKKTSCPQLSTFQLTVQSVWHIRHQVIKWNLENETTCIACTRRHGLINLVTPRLCTYSLILSVSLQSIFPVACLVAPLLLCYTCTCIQLQIFLHFGTISLFVHSAVSSYTSIQPHSVCLIYNFIVVLHAWM